MANSDIPKHAIIDIGSNSVRMVVYEIGRASTPLYNEREGCGLGRNLAKTGYLHPDGVKEATLLLQRFAKLIKSMRVKKITAVATAAVRDAKDGQRFLQSVRAKTGLKIRVLTGAEEARLSATGVCAAFPGASGIMGDMGGGSIELVAMAGGSLGKRISLPLGPLNIMESGLAKSKLMDHIDGQIGALPWLKPAGRKKRFYAVGGTFRAMARVHMQLLNYPLHVVHRYTVLRKPFSKFLDQCVAGQHRNLAEQVKISKTRIAAIPFAAMVLKSLFHRAEFEEVCFSIYGLREGIAYVDEPKSVKSDMVLHACRMLGGSRNRFGLNGDEVFDFLAPLVPRAASHIFRAACWVSDIGWMEHPEQRAWQVFQRLLYAPMLSVDHKDRLFIATACYVRYGGDCKKLPDRYLQLMDFDQFALAKKWGVALRFADTLCAGAPGILSNLDLQLARGHLTLNLPRAWPVAGGDAVPKRFSNLADAFGRNALIIQAGKRR